MFAYKHKKIIIDKSFINDDRRQVYQIYDYKERRYPGSEDNPVHSS